MRYGSVCSGIEAPTVAWEPLGWRPAWFSEIAPFPSRVLAHHFPEVPNHGDFTTIRDAAGIDLLVGGTPCQAFSLAGLRGGMADERGALALEFLRLAARTRPRWVVWENVPGVLSSDGGRAFGAFLGGLAELGYGFAYRVLDAQYFGLAQRRKRVFVVGRAGGQWQRAAAVLLERASLRGDPAPSRAAGASAAGCAEEGSRGGVSLIPFETDQVTSAANRSRCDPGAPAPTRERRSQAPAVAFHMTQRPISGSVSPSISRTSGGMGVATDAVAFHIKQDPVSGAVSPALGRTSDGMGVKSGAAVRRLTPRECERLMGFPDDYTAIPKAKDGPRYAALGNSIAVPVLRWIGERIAQVEAVQ